jgi:hypothetical protein
MARALTNRSKWRKFCVYYTETGGDQGHTPAFATRREAERHAEEMRVREGILEAHVKYTDDPSDAARTA